MKVRGLAVLPTALEDCVTYKSASVYRVFGDRALTDFSESGHQLEGKVSVDGTKRSAFTSSIVVAKRDEAGTDRLYDVSVLYVRNPDLR